MAMQEIERKFLVDIEKWNPQGKGIKITQGYLSVDSERTVRVRIANEKSFLTIKGKSIGISRTELEYEIPLDDAGILMQMCLDIPIEKIRYKDKVNGLLWEVDAFEGENRGLVLAEIELENEEQEVELPAWILEEVSHDHRFFNSWLSKHPYSSWGKYGCQRK